MIYYEIVWAYLGREYSFGWYVSKRAALREFNEGRARVHRLIHGGLLRIDEIVIGDVAA